MKSPEDSMSGEDVARPGDRLSELERISHQVICLRNVSRILSEIDRSMAEVFYRLVHMMPEGWAEPADTVVRICVDDKEWSTTGFEETDSCLCSDIIVRGSKRGYVQACFRPSDPNDLPTDRIEQEFSLLDSITHEIAAFVDRKDMMQMRAQQHREMLVFTSLLRHDVRNDLGVILSNIDLARMMLSKDDDEFHEIMDSTEAVCDRIMSLVSALGKSVRVTETSIADWIGKIATQAQEAHRNMSVEVHLDESIRGIRIPVSRLLPAVFENLLRNAAVYGGNHPTVDIDASAVDNHLEVLVSDDGPGIADEIRDRLFQKGVTTSGSGLGLYLSRQIVEGIGGTIDLVENDDTRGATFRIRLPIGGSDPET